MNKIMAADIIAFVYKTAPRGSKCYAPIYVGKFVT